MIRDTPEQRALAARADIRRLTADIDWHDEQASRLRKLREGHKAKLARAEKAIERSKKFAANVIAKRQRMSETGPVHN